MPHDPARMPRFCTFRFTHAPEDYLDADRIARIWQAMPSILPPGGEAHLHVTPLSGDGDQESDYFLEPDSGATGVPPAPPADLPKNRIRNPWENQTPFAAPALMLSLQPAPGNPEAAAQELRENAGTPVAWHAAPPLAQLFPSGSSVLLPVDTEVVITPDEAAAAWRWLDAFLQRAQQRRPDFWPTTSDTEPVADGFPPAPWLPPPAGWRLRRAMSCSRSLMSFAAPGEGFRCPHCGEDLDDEYIMGVLSEAFEANPEDPDLLLRAPCCGIILPFNALETTWIGFARFCLQFSGCSCTPEDLAELNALIGTPFKIVHVHD